MSRNQRRMMDHHQAMQRSFNDRSGVNPWEGGFAPGGSGLLPTPNASNLLSQLTSPEAQLAVASNLLTSLLRPVTNSLQQGGQLPALMGMGSSGNYSSFGNQQNDSFSARGAYNDYPGISHRRSFESMRSIHAMSVEQRSPMRNVALKRGQQTNRGRQSGSQSKSRTTSTSEQDQQKDTKRDSGSKTQAKDSAEKRGASFEGLPKSAFHCHVCKKDMWDAKSFDNHVLGMAHQKMLAEREKAYMIKAQLMRHEAKLEEQQNEIELERLVRLGKKSAPSRREFCKMCDFAFFGDLALHRKSKIHQQLKSFLHPNCNCCHEDFAMRIDMDRHLVSAAHLKIAFKDKYKNKEDGENESKEGDGKMDVGDTEKTGTEAKAQDEDIEMEEGGDAARKAPKKEKYDPDVPVGEDFMVPVTGIFCKACRRFFLEEDPALESHCRTPGHFNNVMVLKQTISDEQTQKSESKQHEEIILDSEDHENDMEGQEEDEENNEDETSPVAGKRDPTDNIEPEAKRMKQDIGDSDDETVEEEEEEEDITQKIQEIDENIEELEAVVNENIVSSERTPRARRARGRGRGRY